MSFKEEFIKHIPDILTVTASVGTVVSNLLFIDATAKEMEDGDKKHYIFPTIVSASSIFAGVMGSIAKTDENKLLEGALALSIAQNLKQRKVLGEKMTPDELAKFDEVDEFEKAREASKDPRRTIWFSQFGVKFLYDPSLIASVENQVNKDYNLEGHITLDDILHRFGVYDPTRRQEFKQISWTVNPYSDNPQGIVFETVPFNVADDSGEEVIEIKLYKLDGNDWKFS